MAEAAKEKIAVYQLKITLKSIKPDIWRRILILNNSSFAELHDSVNSAMGWLDCHLHLFKKPGLEIVMADDEDDSAVMDAFMLLTGTSWQKPKKLEETKTKLWEHFKKPKDSMNYLYDFGDNWEHSIVLEKVLPFDLRLYPICIAGQRACPPEDCGGSYGYKNLLKALSDPNNPEHKEMKRWMRIIGQDPNFNPELFAPNSVIWHSKVVTEANSYHNSKWETFYKNGATTVVYQLKITLKGIKPSIWRQILILNNSSFGELHHAINRAMGWSDSHLHLFQKHNLEIAPFNNENYSESLDENKVKLWEHLKKPKDTINYLYDFGDNWEHWIVLEKILPFDSRLYPMCINGERACPPDDCGGSNGYKNLLKALSDHNNLDHKEMKRWMNIIGKDPNFNPETFYPDSVIMHSNETAEAISLTVYQLKITLRGITPRIWRRILILNNSSFAEIHHAVNSAMGWSDSHLHLFRKHDLEIVAVDGGNDSSDSLVETKIMLGEYLKKPKDTVTYLYDFGDNWEHSIVLENILPFDSRPYPICIAGKRACPPDDCGGVLGYKNLLKTLSNPNDPEHIAMKRWMRIIGKDPNFDPEIFDPHSVIWHSKEVAKAISYHGSESSFKNDVTTSVYQLKITLKGIKPRIWRRILILSNSSFAELHHAANTAMGWSDLHLHLFHKHNLEIAPVGSQDDYSNLLDETKVKLWEHLKKPQDTVNYLYDFGDNWDHWIVLEKILPFEKRSYPICIFGRRACPPDDCGGADGYENLLKILSYPYHPEHKKMKRWMRSIGKNPNFNPEAFHPNSVNDCHIVYAF